MLFDSSLRVLVPPLAPALAVLLLSMKDLGFINMNHAHVPVSPDSEFDHVVTRASIHSDKNN